MGNLPIHIYGYNNEHDVIVYTVVKDTQRDCGQPHHRFQKSPYWSKLNPGIFKLKRGLEHFQNLWSKGGVVHARLLCAKVMHFKTKTH